MFAYGFWDKNTMNEVNLDDLFVAIESDNKAVIAEYFDTTFAKVKEIIITTQAAKGKGYGAGEIGAEEIKVAIEGTIAEIPSFAVTEKNRDSLESLAGSYEKAMAKTMLMQQKIQEGASSEQDLTPEAQKELEAINKRIEDFGTRRSIALFIAAKIDTSLSQKQSSYSCTIS